MRRMNYYLLRTWPALPSSAVNRPMTMCSGAIKLWALLLEYSSAASRTRFVLIEKERSLAEPEPEAARGSDSVWLWLWLLRRQMLRTARQAWSMVMPDPRNPCELGWRWRCCSSSAIKPSKRCWVNTMSRPRALASLWEKMTALIARSVNRSKTAETIRSLEFFLRLLPWPLRKGRAGLVCSKKEEEKGVGNDRLCERQIGWRETNSFLLRLRA